MSKSNSLFRLTVGFNLRFFKLHT